MLDFQNKCRKLPKALKEWQAFKDLIRKIDDFNAVCPLLERMADKAMKERHWKRIEDLTGHKFDIESEGFSLRNVMEAPLLEHMEDIEVYTLVRAVICFIIDNYHRVSQFDIRDEQHYFFRTYVLPR